MVETIQSTLTIALWYIGYSSVYIIPCILYVYPVARCLHLGPALSESGPLASAGSQPAALFRLLGFYTCFLNPDG
jgi:hypothetical protein